MNSQNVSIDLPVDLTDEQLEVFVRAVKTIAVAYKERTITLEECADRIRLKADFEKSGSPSMQNAHALWEHRGA